MTRSTRPDQTLRQTRPAVHHLIFIPHIAAVGWPAQPQRNMSPVSASGIEGRFSQLIQGRTCLIRLDLTDLTAQEHSSGVSGCAQSSRSGLYRSQISVTSRVPPEDPCRSCKPRLIPAEAREERSVEHWTPAARSSQNAKGQQRQSPRSPLVSDNQAGV